MPTGGHWYSGHNRGRRTVADGSPAHDTGPRISVVVPVLNEARNLRQVLPTVPESYEVIVVDGGSTDDSMDVVERLRPDAIRLRQTRWGKSNALGCGFAAATGDIVVMFDADGWADAREIDAFVATLLAGADFAKGTRFAPGGGSADITTLRRSGNNGLTRLANRLFGMHFTDLCYGYNAFWRDVLPLLGLPDHRPADGVIRWGDGFEIETVITCRAVGRGPGHPRGAQSREASPARTQQPACLAGRTPRVRTLLHEWRSRDRSVRLSAAAAHFAPRRTERLCGERAPRRAGDPAHR